MRSIKEAFIKTSAQQKCSVTELAHGNRGRPLKLGEFDARVQQYIRKLREAGGIVNCTIAIAAARGIVQNDNPMILNEAGGPIDIGTAWAKSLLQRMNYVRRKGTKAARKLPEDFENIRRCFIERVSTTVHDNSVPLELFVNFDQTNAKYVPTSEWTVAEEGSRQVDILGLEDKREMTVLMGCTASGVLLPPQLLYAGKTEQCHPKGCHFPVGWDIWHTESHWSTKETMRRYAENVLIPFFKAQRKAHGFASEQTGIALFDVFKAHQDEEFLNMLQDNNITPLFVPASCTGELQPLDLTINSEFKRLLKSRFITWYAAEVRKQLEHAEETREDAGQASVISTHKVDLRISVLKPRHAHWLIDTITELEQNSELIKAGFRQAGITAVYAQ